MNFKMPSSQNTPPGHFVLKNCFTNQSNDNPSMSVTAIKEKVLFNCRCTALTKAPKWTLYSFSLPHQINPPKHGAYLQRFYRHLQVD